MHIHCHLGRIAPVESAPSSVLRGAQNSRKWILDVSCSEHTQISIQLVDWRSGFQSLNRATGKPTLTGPLDPRLVPLNEAATHARVYFPVASDGNLLAVVKPFKGHEGELQFRLVVEAPNTITA